MKIAIRGHESRGKEVIQILKNLGGINRMYHSGRFVNYFYYISSDDNTITWTCIRSEYFKVYTLEEFEKEFPFKIGDRIISATTNYIGTITELKENGCYQVKYDNGNLVFTFSENLKPYKEMKEERNITLTLDKAKEWYKKGGELKEVALQAFTEKELTKIYLPKTWEEFCENYPVKKGEYWIGTQDALYSTTNIQDRIYKNWIPSRKSAEAHLAMIQLEQLRDCWWNGWTPIWDISEKWCIHSWGNELCVGITTNISRFLTFPTKEMAEEFLECFRDLIKKARDLI